MAASFPFLLWLGWLLGGNPLPVLANVGLEIDKAEAAKWTLSGLIIDLRQPNGAAMSIQARLEFFDYEGLGRIVQHGIWQCAPLVMGTGRFRCQRGWLEMADSLLGAQRIGLDIDYADASRWSLRLRGLRLAQGVVSAEIDWNVDRWTIDGAGKGLRLQALPPLLSRHLPSGWEWSGETDIEWQASGRDSDMDRLRLELKAAQLSYADSDGLQAAEGLSLQGELDLSRNRDGWVGSVAVKLSGGQMYSDPWYLEFDRQPLSLDFSGSWAQENGHLQLSSYRFAIAGMVEAQGRMEMSTHSFQPRKVYSRFSSTDVGALYQSLLQPLLIGGSLDSLTLSGKLAGEARLEDGKWQMLRFRLQGLDLEDGSDRFGVSGLEADIDWSGDARVTTSQLSWTDAHVFQLQLGALDSRFYSADDVLHSRNPFVVPLLQGELQIDELHIGGLFAGTMGGYVSASLRDLQLAELTEALGWPTMQGMLQGNIPRISLVPGRLLLDGDLTVGVFGGELRVRNLSIADPFGVLPVLEAELDLRELDLGQLTRTFSLGRIEGGLEGEVRNLQLIGWQPSRFDLSLRTPEDDERRHRISQRAIDDLTSLGNGVSGNLSGTFLRFFEDFSYSQLAMDVSLSGNVAYLGGIDLPDGGYYLVKGASLPRIDVIGRNRRIAWKELLRRIEEVQLDGAVIN